jgi:hypothetical protein
VRGSELVKIWNQAFRIGELEIRMKLNPVGCAGDLQSLLHRGFRFGSLAARTSYPSSALDTMDLLAGRESSTI